MILTKSCVQRNRQKVKRWIRLQKRLGKDSVVIKQGSACLNTRVHADFSCTCLDDIRIIRAASREWASTDGSTIWLNQTRFENEVGNVNTIVFWTILHESLHGVIRCRNVMINEEQEHFIINVMHRFSLHMIN